MGRKGKKRSSTNNRNNSGSGRKGKSAKDVPPEPAAASNNVGGENCITDGDLEGIKCWIKSLTFETLIKSLEFDFQRDEEPITTRCDLAPPPPPSPSHADEQQQKQSISQDFDLLMKMTSLQCSSKLNVCSSVGDECYHHQSNDICDGHDTRRHHMIHIDNLCLFRLVAPQTEGKDKKSSSTNNNNDERSKPERVEPINLFQEQLSLGATNLPAELMDILAQAGVKRSNSDLLETFNELDDFDEAFADSLDTNNNEGEHHASSFIQYQIETHTGIADDGMVLGQGTTFEQQTADRLMLLWSVLISDLSNQSSSSTNTSNRDNSSSSDLPQCKLHPHIFSLTSPDKKKQLLDLLRITSRGKFLSAQGERSQAYWAPWFKPTEQWFSLPMYLASRFEAALWDAYFDRTKVDERKKEPKVNLLTQCVEHLDEEAVARVLSYAFGVAVKNEMIDMRYKLSEGPSSFEAISVLNNLLGNLLKYTVDYGKELPIHQLEYLSVSPLIMWDTPCVKLKALAMLYIREGVSYEAEKSLMQSLSTEDTRTTIQKKRKTIRKKRLSHHQPEILSTLEEEQNEEEQESESDEDDPIVQAILSSTSAGTIIESNNTSVLNVSTNCDDTIEKITVLQVIDDILTTVFQRLGIEEESDFNNAVLVTPRSETCQKDNANIENDIEAATTAIVSNKAGGSVEAAMKFLSRKDTDVSSHSHSPKRSQQLWASRTRKDAGQQLGLKRCLSSGAQAVDSEINQPPLHPQSNRSHSRSSSLNYSAISEAFGPDSTSMMTNLLEKDGDKIRTENNTAEVDSSDFDDPGLNIDDEFHDPTHQTHQRLNPDDGVGPPSTPPPLTLSLSDLGKQRGETQAEDKNNGGGLPPSTPIQSPSKAARPRTMTASLSRDDLRSIDERSKLPRRNRDDYHTMGHPQVDALLSYRNAVAQASGPRKPVSVQSHDGKQKHREDARPIVPRSVKSTRTGLFAPGDFPSLNSSVASIHSYREPMINKILHLDLACARSESALDADGAEDASHCNVIPTHNDDTITKDGATTISSVHSEVVPERLVSSLKEERNSYRDMCLTLGAENAKLRNLLASKVCAPLYHPPHFSAEPQASYAQQPYYDNPFNPSYHQHMSMYNGGANFTSRPMVAMSDAGLHRGDHDSSVMSEDGTDFHTSVVGFNESQSISWQPRGDSVHSFSRRTSIGGTYADSDASFEYTGGPGPGFHRVQYQDSFFGPIPLHGMQSRLSKDIDRYMQSLKTQLKKNEHRRTFAIDQITKAVKALWPRAQIKMYGSHVTKLCLPSSDMDFVICLPAVHKNAPATTPGDLEGRNAINETNQKILARKLKGENWLGKSCKAST
jgi:hypothetical protein